MVETKSKQLDTKEKPELFNNITTFKFVPVISEKF